MSISALLDRLSWLVLQTRSLALTSFHAAAQKNSGWHRKHFKRPRVARAPSSSWTLEPRWDATTLGKEDDRTNIFHPRFVGEGMPESNTFHSVVYERLGKNSSDVDSWCAEGAWFARLPQYDFRVKNAYGYIWGLPRKARDNKRGYARVTPVALSKDGVSGQAMYPVDHYPLEGLGIYEDFESCSHF